MLEMGVGESLSRRNGNGRLEGPGEAAIYMRNLLGWLRLGWLKIARIILT